MLGWAIAFFALLVVAAFFGFTGEGGGAAIAKALFFVFLVGFVVTLVIGFRRGGGTQAHREDLF